MAERCRIGLTELDNLILALHTGSGSLNVRRIMAEMAAKRIASVLKGGMQ